MTQLMIKIVSTILFFLFFYFSLLFYLSDSFKSKVVKSRASHDFAIINYGMTLPKIEVNKNFKKFIDNSEYFKKIDKEPKFWELIK